MIKVRVRVHNGIGSFTVAVRAENLRQAARIARDLYPGCAVGIAFPIEPDGFFAAGSRQDGRVGLGGPKRTGERQGPSGLGPLGAEFSPCTEPPSGALYAPEGKGAMKSKRRGRLAGA
jgi:hypothetical protein